MGRAASKRRKDRLRMVDRIRQVIRGRIFFDRDLKETVQLEYGSVQVGDVFLWTDPGQVLSDPYGRGTLDRII